MRKLGVVLVESQAAFHVISLGKASPTRPLDVILQ
mgnify:CR=1 FL=1